MKTLEGNGKEHLLRTNMFSVWLTVPNGSVSGIEEDLKEKFLAAKPPYSVSIIITLITKNNNTITIHECI